VTAVLPGRVLTDAVHEQVEYEVDVAYAAGYQQAIHDICTRVVELELINRHVWDKARADALRRVAERRSAYLTPSPGDYRGGPVDWETGKPQPEVCP
jgi:hypothetical protein